MTSVTLGHVVFMNSCWNSFKQLLILNLIFLQEPGGSESSDGSSEDNRRQRVADRPSVSHPLCSAPLPAPPQLRLHLSQLLKEGVSHWHWSGIGALWKAQTLINRGGQGPQISAGGATLSLSFLFKGGSLDLTAINTATACQSSAERNGTP